MKNIEKIGAIVLLIIGYMAVAQPVNYKKLAVPSVNIQGNVLNAKGIVLGFVDDQGIIKNAKGEKIAFIDAFGTLIESQSDKRIVKCDINGNVYEIKITKGYFKGWKLNMPEPGVEICLLRDDKKKIVGATHKHFKQYAGVTIYYFMKKNKK